MHIVRRARESGLQKEKGRVFLVWSGTSTEERDALIDMALSYETGSNCVISYIEKPEGGIDEEALRWELREARLLLALVDEGYLDAMQKGERPELDIARGIGLPVAPIASTATLFPRLGEVMGAVHGIAMSDPAFPEKLRRQLDTFLPTGDMARQIREGAFSARIFLSYRKKDIQVAHDFMKAFHDRGFEGVAVWYDGFLTGGRLFDAEIRAAIDACDVFVLLATPHIAKEGNYVLQEEYPYAVAQGKPIVAVETGGLAPEALAAAFARVDGQTGLGDLFPFIMAFRRVLPPETFGEKLEGERAYLLGLAYLHGVMVEPDMQRAYNLLSRAAEGEHLKAALTLVLLFGQRQATAKEAYWLRKAIDITTAERGAQSVEVAALYSDLGAACHKMGEHAQAERYGSLALGIREGALGPYDDAIAVSCANLGILYEDTGRYGEALSMQRRALDIHIRNHGDGDAEAALIYHNIASIHRVMGESKQALAWYEKALTIREREMGPEDATTGFTCHQIGMTLMAEGNLDGAMAMTQRGLAINRKVLGEWHPDTAASYNNAAAIYLKREQYADAVECMEKATAAFEALDATHQSLAGTYSNLGTAYLGMDEFEKASAAYHRAYALLVKTHGRDDSRVVAIEEMQISICKALREDSSQSRDMEKALLAARLAESVFSETSVHRALAYDNLANLHVIYQTDASLREVLGWYEKALAVKRAALGETHPVTAAGRVAMAWAHYGLGEWEVARSLVEAAYGILLVHGHEAAQHAANLLVLLKDEGDSG